MNLKHDEKRRRIGLFFGAGASFELGMPLVAHLTAEFKGYYSPEHLRKLNTGWEAQGYGYSSTFIEEIISVLQRKEMNYENILGYLQTQVNRRENGLARDYHTMHQQMLEIVYELLYIRQIRNLRYIVQGLPPFMGIQHFANVSSPLWIFSLNHDVLAEILLHQCGIAFRDGFWAGAPVEIPFQLGGRTHTLFADTITATDIAKMKLNLFKVGERGVNLIKLHGSVNTFTVFDGQDICRLRPFTNSLEGYLTSLFIVNKHVQNSMGEQRIHPTNELVYKDSSGAIQFLRKTILAGAYKFENRFQQTLPQEWLNVFRAQIGYIDELIVIGYSFGDTHIDHIIRDWLGFASSRTLTVVDPAGKQLSPYFSHLSPQISYVRKSAGEYFAGFRNTPLNIFKKAELFQRSLLRPFIEYQASKKHHNQRAGWTPKSG